MFGWVRTKDRKPRPSEYVRVSTFPFGVALYGQYGANGCFHYSDSTTGTCNPTWWRRVRNGDCLIVEIEYARRRLEMSSNAELWGGAPIGAASHTSAGLCPGD